MKRILCLLSMVASLGAFAANDKAAQDKAPVKADGSFSAIGDPTFLSLCTLSSFPGGFTCPSGQSLGAVYSATQLRALLTGSSFGCSEAPIGGAFACTRDKPFPGIWFVYTYTGTDDASRIIYVPF